MSIKRLFSYDEHKGEYLYLDTQRKYEIARTVLYFAISFAIFFIGFFTTGTKKNLLTIVAVLGMLPASKSLVSVIMFARYKSFREEIEVPDVLCAYDCVFTSEKKNFVVNHLCVAGSCIIGYSVDKGFDEKVFREHILTILSVEKYTDVTVKVFTDVKAYLARIEMLGTSDDKKDAGIMAVLKQIIL